MTTGNVYLDLFIGGLLGMLFQVFVLKMPALKKRAEAANVEFKPMDYFKTDWLALSTSVLSIVIGVFVFDELTNSYPSIVKYAKFFFIFVGYTGASFLQGVLGVYDTRVRNIVNEKTNIADAK